MLTFSQDIMESYVENQQYMIVTLGYTIFGLCAINVFFNYLSAMITSPGTTKDEEYRSMLNTLTDQEGTI